MRRANPNVMQLHQCTGGQASLGVETLKIFFFKKILVLLKKEMLFSSYATLAELYKDLGLAAEVDKGTCDLKTFQHNRSKLIKNLKRPT